MARKSDPKKKPGKAVLKESDLVPKGYEKFLGDSRNGSGRHSSGRQSRSTGSLSSLLADRPTLARQKEHGWGRPIIDRLAGDLRRAFPGMAGFSRDQVSMRAFALAYADAPELCNSLLHKLSRLAPRVW